MARVGGGGPKYEEAGKRAPPEPEELIGDRRKERIEGVLAHRTRTLSVVLDRLEDTFNMAAVLRTCEAMGVQDVHIIENPDVPFRPNGKVTQGCDKWLDLHVHRDFEACRQALKAAGLAIWASAVRPGGKTLDELSFDAPIAVVFGNERFGASDEVLAGADGTFWIPMHGFTRSLNVSAAASATVTRAVAWRQRHLGRSGDLTAEQAEALRRRFLHLSVKQRGRIYR